MRNHGDISITQKDSLTEKTAQFLYPFERVDHFGLSDDAASRAEDAVLRAMSVGGDAALPDWPHAGGGGSKRSRSSRADGGGGG